MADNAIYAKTEQGVAEIAARSQSLSSQLRRLLILIDGVKTIDELRNFVRPREDLEKYCDELYHRGLIAPAQDASYAVPSFAADVTAADEEIANRSDDTAPERSNAQRYAEGQRFMTTTIADNLGMKSFMFTLKIEKCSSVEDLLALLDAYEAALAKAAGDEKARFLRRKAENILR